MKPTRRALLAGAAALGGVTLLRCGGATRLSRAGRLAETRLGAAGITLTAKERAISLVAKGTTPAWLYTDAPFPVLRVHAGETISATLANGLTQHSTIHWHGVRLPNTMDGVPDLTQLPVQPGERFTYRFAAKDPGLFIFHPHCNTAEQFGRGLAGILIVDGNESAAFDDDVLCVLKDWRLAEDGNFLPFVTMAGASRAGSFGTLRTCNARNAPAIEVPAGADIRLRIVNLDATRIGDIGIEGAQAFVIAIDGNAVTPFVLEDWRLGPAMRIELALRTPADGKRVMLMDYFASTPVMLASLVARGTAKNAAIPVRALKPASFPEPDLANAKMHALQLNQSAAGSQYPALPLILPGGQRIDLLDSLCATTRSLWAIDGKTWPEQGHRNLPPPIMAFARGETALIEFLNTTREPHPMHLHGHVFKVLSCSKLSRPVHWADTVLVMPDERVRIAFVADNPGNWMLHCHIIEHQETGMMAWFRVA